MQNLPWHVDPGLSVAEALYKWSEALLAEKAEAVKMLEEAKKLKTVAGDHMANFQSHKTAVEGASAANAQLKGQLDQKAIALQAKERDLVSRETALKEGLEELDRKSRVSSDTLNDFRRGLESREAKLRDAEQALADEKSAHEKRVKRVKEALV